MVTDKNGYETWGAVAPVHQLILPLDGLAELRGPVAVLFLLHKEVHALPHQLLVRGLEVLMVRKKHLEDGRQAMSCSYTDKRSIVNSIGRRTSWKSGPKYDKWMKGMGKARHPGQKEQAQTLLETMLGRTKEAKEKAGVWRGRQAIYTGPCKSCWQGAMGRL